MSATNRGGERLDLDAYLTDPRVAQAIVEDLLPIGPHDVVVESHAGDGAWVDALLLKTPSVFGFDLNPEACLRHGWTERDWLAPGDLDVEADWIVGNPPYDGFDQHVDRALERAPNVAYLLRRGAVESARRRDWWALPGRQPAVTIDLVERPSFRGLRRKDGRPKRGTDQTLYSVFVWRRSLLGPKITESHLYSWRTRRLIW